MSLAQPLPRQSTRQTALVRCENYKPLTVRAAVRRCLDLLGSPERVIRPGDTVLLKPNLLTAKEPERAITTHPEIVAAVGEVVLDCRGKIILGDSPGGQAKHIQRYWDKTGLSEAAKHLGIIPVSFEEAGVCSFPAPQGFIGISRLALEVDHIINLPKLKTHQLTRMTGAVKNMFGAVPGFRKGDIHARAPEPLAFARFLISVYQQVTPTFSIMDAVIAMEGNGPSSGNPRYVGALLAADDAFALDSVAAQIIGMEEAKLPIFKAAIEAGLWIPQKSTSQVRGEDLFDLRVADFKAPDISRIERIPQFVQHGLKKLVWVRPKANSYLCNSCGRCVESCPEHAMRFKSGVPVIDYQRCIKCSCCDELCPERAIYQELSLLAKILS